MLYTFEDGVKPNFIYSGYGGSWPITTLARYSGSYSLSSPDIYDSQYTRASIAVQGGTLSFYYYIQSEGGYDFFRLYIDGSQYISTSGYVGWNYFIISLSPGNHSVIFEYSKDGSVSSGYDCVFIDQLNLPLSNNYQISSVASVTSGGTLTNINTSTSLYSLSSNYIDINAIFSIVNGQPSSNFSLEYEKRIYNLSDDLIDTIELYIEPISLNSNVNGHDELLDGLWIFSDHYIDIRINNNNYHISKIGDGTSVTNPIVFRLSDQDNIHYLYGSDNTSRGKDWIRYINHSDKLASVLNSLSSSGNIVYNKVYFLNHSINYSSTNYIKVQIYLRNDLSEKNMKILRKQLSKCRIVFAQNTYQKNISNTIGVLYGDEIIVRQEGYNIRW